MGLKSPPKITFYDYTETKVDTLSIYEKLGIGIDIYTKIDYLIVVIKTPKRINYENNIP